ncbi:hypothetical protein V8F06_007159 [Rhypophila decipiens]
MFIRLPFADARRTGDATFLQIGRAGGSQWMVNRQQMRIFAGHEKPISQRVNDASTVDVNTRYIHMVETIRHPLTTTLTDILGSPRLLQAGLGDRGISKHHLLFSNPLKCRAVQGRLITRSYDCCTEYCGYSAHKGHTCQSTSPHQIRLRFRGAIPERTVHQFLLSPIEGGISDSHVPYCTVRIPRTYDIETKPHENSGDRQELTRKWWVRVERLQPQPSWTADHYAHATGVDPLRVSRV